MLVSNFTHVDFLHFPQTDLVKIRQAYAETTASQRRLQNQKAQLDTEADDWYQRAQLALQRGREDLAREALNRRQLLVDKSQALDTQLSTQQAASEKLYTAMMTLEGKIKEAVAQKEQLIARARTAKSMQQVNEMLNALVSSATATSGKNAMAAFARMQEKVEAMEVAAEASADLNNLSFGDQSLEAQFLALEQSSSVENELEKMKADLKLLGPGTNVNNQNVSASNRRTVERIPITSGRSEFTF